MIGDTISSWAIKEGLFLKENSQWSECYGRIYEFVKDNYEVNFRGEYSLSGAQFPLEAWVSVRDQYPLIESVFHQYWGYQRGFWRLN